MQYKGEQAGEAICCIPSALLANLDSLTCFKEKATLKQVIQSPKEKEEKEKEQKACLTGCK